MRFPKLHTIWRGVSLPARSGLLSNLGRRCFRSWLPKTWLWCESFLTAPKSFLMFECGSVGSPSSGVVYWIKSQVLSYNSKGPTAQCLRSRDCAFPLQDRAGSACAYMQMAVAALDVTYFHSGATLSVLRKCMGL